MMYKKSVLLILSLILLLIMLVGQGYWVSTVQAASPLQATVIPVTPAATNPPAQPVPAVDPKTVWKWTMPGQVVDAPILLYHHVSDDPKTFSYGMDLAGFRQQMQLLKDRGYQTIPFSTLVTAIKQGAALPTRPVVITFDDGALDVYENAFPIMKEFGFTGTFFLVGYYLDSPGHVSGDQAKEMAAAGWEIGSHSLTHTDLSKSPDMPNEVAGSRRFLQERLGVPVNILAYPYGMVGDEVFAKTIDAGYLGGGGLGISWEHSPSNLFYINRIEVKYGTSPERFNAMLPW